MTYYKILQKILTTLILVSEFIKLSNKLRNI